MLTVADTEFPVKKLPPKWIKVLKMFHVLCLSIWIGAGVALLLLGFVRPETTAEAYMHARTIQAIDTYMVIVFASALLVTGLLYSVFTHWGFVKHKWIIAKWVILIFQIIFGALVLGPHASENVSMAQSMTGPLSDYPKYFDNLDKTTVLGAAQLALLLFVIFVSVWKPWGRVKRTQEVIASAKVTTESASAG